MTIRLLSLNTKRLLLVGNSGSPRQSRSSNALRCSTPRSFMYPLRTTNAEPSTSPRLLIPRPQAWSPLTGLKQHRLTRSGIKAKSAAPAKRSPVCPSYNSLIVDPAESERICDGRAEIEQSGLSVL